MLFILLWVNCVCTYSCVQSGLTVRSSEGYHLSFPRRLFRSFLLRNYSNIHHIKSIHVSRAGATKRGYNWLCCTSRCACTFKIFNSKPPCTHKSWQVSHPCLICCDAMLSDVVYRGNRTSVTLSGF